MSKRCVIVYSYIALIIFLIYIVISLWTLHTDPEISDALRDEISQEESDFKKLDRLNPFKDISNIKALARKKYGARRHILQTACDKIKGMNY